MFVTTSIEYQSDSLLVLLQTVPVSKLYPARDFFALNRQVTQEDRNWFHSLLKENATLCGKNC
jgi:hypothetical protein